MVYLDLHESNQATDWLERAYEQRSWNLDFLKVDTTYDPLCSNPRFRELYRKMSFPP